MNAYRHALFASLLFSCTTFSFADSASVEVLSAVVKDQKISDAEVLLQRNGEQSSIRRTDAQGRATLPENYPDDGSSLLIVRKSGYSNLVVKCPCRGMTYAISPVMQNLDGMRVVLSWGATPPDLDSHMAFRGNHIFFSSRNGSDANLDVDDVDGYGPETITLTRKHFGEPYVYSVHNYTDSGRPNSTTLSESQAKVLVYIGQSLVRTYYVPRNQPGNLWTVFRLTGDGEFEDINHISGVAVGAGQIDKETASYLTAISVQPAASDETAALADAKRLNQQGEAAYHAGQLDTAIDFYRRAIEVDPAYGQAFSNLGLAYQKVGRDAESIWANRKAIALASGSGAPTVRASSYYNIGRIYEVAGQFADALRSYQSAKAQKANPVYDKAIQRVISK
ncbi:MAG: tetratricopeptide repeat protein [Pseudomonas sp.]